MVSWNLPLLVLGGGGYNSENAARVWARTTARLCGTELEDDIPEHPYFQNYGPDFKLSLEPSPIPDKNNHATWQKVSQHFPWLWNTSQEQPSRQPDPYRQSS